MGEDPEQLRAEIARTRAELGQDLDTLVEKVSPSKVVERKVDATKEAVVGVKDKIMGTASAAKESVMGSSPSTGTYATSGAVGHGGGHGVGDRVGSAGSAVAGAAGSAGHAVQGAASSAGAAVQDAASSAVHGVTAAAQSAPAQVTQKAAGNPLAAGVIAFGLGWLVSSLLPATKVERQGASALKDAASSVAEPVKQGLTAAATEVKENLAPAAQEAVAVVKQEAADAASAVKDTAGQAGSQVTDQATSAAGTVKDTAKSAAQDAKQEATSPSTPPAPAYPSETTTVLVVDEDATTPGTATTGGVSYFDEPPSRPTR